jgi:hypothetical protein
MDEPTGADCLKVFSKPSRDKSLRCYVIASAVIFALMLLAHIARVLAEGTNILSEPIIVVTSAISLGMVLWALVLLIRRPR